MCSAALLGLHWGRSFYNFWVRVNFIYTQQKKVSFSLHNKIRVQCEILILNIERRRRRLAYLQNWSWRKVDKVQIWKPSTHTHTRTHTHSYTDRHFDIEIYNFVATFGSCPYPLRFGLPKVLMNSCLLFACCRLEWRQLIRKSSHTHTHTGTPKEHMQCVGKVNKISVLCLRECLAVSWQAGRGGPKGSSLEVQSEGSQ